jgi:hypothetical protein
MKSRDITSAIFVIFVVIAVWGPELGKRVGETVRAYQTEMLP